MARRNTKNENVNTNENVIMMNTAVQRHVNEVDPANNRLYDLTMQNVTEVGNKGLGSFKKFALVPIELTNVNESYQRTETSSSQKINYLANNWDENAYEPIRVSPHPETCTFDVIDGYHRLSAAKLRGQTYIVCEIIDFTNLPTNQRVKAEAELFAGQTKGRNPLSPIEKHKANLLLGDPVCVALQQILDKYGIVLNQDRKGKRGGRSKKGKFAAYTSALAIIRVHGKEVLDATIDILCNARWNLATDGFSQRNVRSISQVMILHPDYIDEIKEAMTNYLTPMQPLELTSAAHTAYPRRKEDERMVMHLEDVMAEKIGFDLVYKVEEREIDAMINRMTA